MYHTIDIHMFSVDAKKRQIHVLSALAAASGVLPSFYLSGKKGNSVVSRLKRQQRRLVGNASYLNNLKRNGNGIGLPPMLENRYSTSSLISTTDDKAKKKQKLSSLQFQAKKMRGRRYASSPRQLGLIAIIPEVVVGDPREEVNTVEQAVRNLHYKKPHQALEVYRIPMSSNTNAALKHVHKLIDKSRRVPFAVFLKSTLPFFLVFRCNKFSHIHKFSRLRRPATWKTIITDIQADPKYRSLVTKVHCKDTTVPRLHPEAFLQKHYMTDAQANASLATLDELARILRDSKHAMNTLSNPRTSTRNSSKRGSPKYLSSSTPRTPSSVKSNTNTNNNTNTNREQTPEWWRKNHAPTTQGNGKWKNPASR